MDKLLRDAHVLRRMTQHAAVGGGSKAKEAKEAEEAEVGVDVTPRDVLDVVLRWCDGGADLRDRELLIWQSIVDLRIDFLSDPHFVCKNLPLPDGLRTLTFGPYFNFRIDHIRIPDTVVILEFGKWWDQSLASVSLPCGLQELRFGMAFNQSLDDVDWPVNLKILQLGRAFQRSLTTVPKGIQILQW